MEEGYPGNLGVKVTYDLSDDNELTIVYEATTDKKTVINLSNHSFFNLNGPGTGTINGHQLMIPADYYTPVTRTLIPTGEIAKVDDTPFDFRKLTAIGKRLFDDDIQLKYGKGYDHNFILNGNDGKRLKMAASVIADISGIKMDVFTEEPAVQFYGGNFMQSENTLRGGMKDDFRTAFCLETQHYPDSPNHPAFPSTVLEPGELYKTSTVFRFSVTG